MDLTDVIWGDCFGMCRRGKSFARGRMVCDGSFWRLVLMFAEIELNSEVEADGKDGSLVVR